MRFEHKTDLTLINRSESMSNIIVLSGSQCHWCVIIMVVFFLQAQHATGASHMRHTFPSQPSTIFHKRSHTLLYAWTGLVHRLPQQLFMEMSTQQLSTTATADSYRSPHSYIMRFFSQTRHRTVQWQLPHLSSHNSTVTINIRMASGIQTAQSFKLPPQT